MEVLLTSPKMPYTAAAGAAFRGGERLRLANEGSIRENIKEFLKRLFGMTIAHAGESSLPQTPPSLTRFSQKSYVLPAQTGRTVCGGRRFPHKGR